MMNSSNGMISAPSSSSANPHSPGIKTYFKTPEGKYKLHYEKTHPSGLLHYTHGKTVTQVTLAHLKDKPAPSTPTGTSSSYTASSGFRSATARLLGGGNGNRALSFVGSNGGTKNVGASSRIGASFPASSSSTSATNTNFDGKGTYLVFNVGDAIFISDLNSQDKDPVKSIHISNSNPMCHAFDADAKDGHDLLIGLNSGDVYTVSLRQQLQDVGKKLVSAQHYNKDGSVNNSRCTSIAWVPGGDGSFVAAHADGNLYVYEKNREGATDSSFSAIRDPTQFSVDKAKYSKSNPVARWHIGQGAINCIAFSNDGAYLATVGRDGYLRIFDFSTQKLVCGVKSYYGALLCCAWSMDGKYLLTGGEDDLVQVWSMEDRKVVAWGEGHNSWVSGVAFDSYWSSPNSEGSGENVMYRFGSVGQDTQLLLWDLEMDEIVVPLRRPPGGSPTYSTGSQSAHWDNIVPMGTLQPAPCMRDVPKISPVVAHRVHTEPLSGLIFTQESLITACREGHLKIWTRPDTQSSSSEATNPTTSKPLLTSKEVLSKRNSPNPLQTSELPSDTVTAPCTNSRTVTFGHDVGRVDKISRIIFMAGEINFGTDRILSSTELRDIVHLKTIVPQLVIDIFINSIKIDWQAKTSILKHQDVSFFYSTFVYELFKHYPKFSKTTEKGMYEFDHDLLECTPTRHERVYLPFLCDKQHWVGLFVDMKDWKMTVLDCFTGLWREPKLKNVLLPLAEMLPYLFRFASKKGVMAAHLIEAHAHGGIDACKRVKVVDGFTAAKKYMIAAYELANETV